MQPLNEALVGSGVTEDEDSDAAFSISIEAGSYDVSGVCLSDNEAFRIEDVVWHGANLSFTAIMPSTGFRSKNSFGIRPDGKAQLELTIYEVWKKRG